MRVTGILYPRIAAPFSTFRIHMVESASGSQERKTAFCVRSLAAFLFSFYSLCSESNFRTLNITTDARVKGI